MNGIIDTICGYKPSELIPIKNVIDKSKTPVNNVEAYNSESRLYHNIEFQLLDFLQELAQIRKQTGVSATPIIDEIKDTCYLLFCVIENYTNKTININKYCGINGKSQEEVLSVFPGEKHYTTIRDFTSDYGDALPSDESKQFAKNRQKFVQEIFIEMLVSARDINEKQVQCDIEKQVATMIVTVDKSYTTQTLVKNNIPTENSPQSSKYNQIGVKTV